MESLGLQGWFGEIAWQELLLTWLGALVLLLVGLRVARWLSRIAERGMTRAQVEPTAVAFLRKVAYVILLVVLFTWSTVSAWGSPGR